MPLLLYIHIYISLTHSRVPHSPKAAWAANGSGQVGLIVPPLGLIILHLATGLSVVDVCVCAHSEVVVELVLGVLGVCCVLIESHFGRSVIFVCPQALAVCPQAVCCVPSGWFQSILCSAHSCMMWFISSLVMILVGSCGSIPSVVSWIIILFLTVSCHFVLGLPALLKSALTLDPFSFIEIFFIGSSSLSLSMCAYSVICF